MKEALNGAWVDPLNQPYIIQNYWVNSLGSNLSPFTPKSIYTRVGSFVPTLESKFSLYQAKDEHWVTSLPWLSDRPDEIDPLKMLLRIVGIPKIKLQVGIQVPHPFKNQTFQFKYQSLD